MINDFIKKNLTLSSLLIFSLLIIINNFYRFFQNNSVYEFDPWLSNYQGGFVRRGIPGELFYQLYNFTGIHPGWMVFIFVTILYIFFYINFFKIIKSIKINALHLFIIFSPISFFFPVLNSKASGHKEIFFLFFLSYLCLLIPKISKKQASIIIIFISIILGLTYEVLIFYLIFLIAPFVFFYDFKNLKDLLKNLLPILFVCLSLLALNYHFSGNEKHTIEICNSVEKYVSPECKKIGKIADLSLILDGHKSQKANWNYGTSSLYPAYYIIYGFGFLIGFLPLFILYNKINFKKKLVNNVKINPIIILLFMLLFSLPVFYLGADWGRYLYIGYLSSIIFTFFSIKNEILIYKERPTTIKKTRITKFLFIISIIIYCFGWTVPICCQKSLKPGIYQVYQKFKMHY